MTDQITVKAIQRTSYSAGRHLNGGRIEFDLGEQFQMRARDVPREVAKERVFVPRTKPAPARKPKNKEK